MRAESSNVCYVPDVCAGLGVPGQALLAWLVKLRRVANQAHTGIPTVGESDSDALERMAHQGAGRFTGNGPLIFPVVDGGRCDAGTLGQFLLRPLEKSACGTNVLGGDCFYHFFLACFRHLWRKCFENFISGRWRGSDATAHVRRDETPTERGAAYPLGANGSSLRGG